jgi:hypothetical protein
MQGRYFFKEMKMYRKGTLMAKKIIICLGILLFVLGCEQFTSSTDPIEEVPVIIWKGSRTSAPAAPEIGMAYYNTIDKKSYIWDGDSWEILAQDGLSIIWKGELPAAPSNPQTNWAYYNIIDGNSYIWGGSEWDFLAKAGRDGSSGIMLWLGSLAVAPSSPSTGYAYYNTTQGVSYIWDGYSWEILARNGQDGSDGTNGVNGAGIVWQGALNTPPLNPETNWAYYSTVSNTSSIWDGDSWEILAQSGNSTVVVSISWKGSLTSAPFSPQIGWMYYNSVLGKTYVWDGSTWNIVAQDGTSPEGFLITWKGGLANAPSTPQQGWAYYDTSQKKSYIWDGSSWQILAQDGADGQDGAGGSGSGTYGPWLYVILYTPEGNYTQYNTTGMDTVNFGKVGIGSTARSSTFYIGLVGGENTTFNLTGSPAIQVSGTDAACFTVTQPSATSTVTGTYIMDAGIAFTPTSAGTKTATITIPNDSPDKPNFSFTVTGLGSIWPKTYDGGEGDGDDQITCSVVDSLGNVYFIGYGFELVNHHSGSDWWIKKIDSAGNEVSSGWDKKIDLTGTTSTTYDKPTNALIDTANNLYVSDGYYTIKFAPDGTELWRKNTGGTLYLDSQNNVFIVSGSAITKYNSAGTQLWTKGYTGKLAFDDSDNISVFSSSTLRYISSGGTEAWTKSLSNILINPFYNSDGWYNGYIGTNGGVESWEFNVVSGKTYYIKWNQNVYGDGSTNALVQVSASWKGNGSYIFKDIFDGWSTPQSFSAAETGIVVVRFVTYSNYVGSYAIKCYDSTNTPLSTTRKASFYINDAIFDSSNNLYIAGYGVDIVDNYSKKDTWIKKYDSSGAEISSGWNKMLDSGHSDDDYATKILFNGTNIIVAGQGNDLINGASDDDGWVKIFTMGGSPVSDFVIPDPNAVLLRIDGSGNYYFSYDSTYSPKFRKYNPSGNLLLTLNDKSPYVSYAVFSFDGSDNIYISGCQSNLITSESNYDWIIKK